MIPPALQAVLARVIWAPDHGAESMWSPSRCRCCGRARDIRERLSHERDGRDHVQGCAVLELLAALREEYDVATATARVQRREG